MDQMTPMSRHSRTRASISSVRPLLFLLPSSSSTDPQGVTPSPYIPSSGSFPTDPRHHALDGRYSSSSTSGGSGGAGNPTSSGGFDHQNQNQPQPPNQHQSYSHGPPPHTMPRNGMMYPTDDGFPRDTESWAVSPSWTGYHLLDIADKDRAALLRSHHRCRTRTPCTQVHRALIRTMIILDTDSRDIKSILKVMSRGRFRPPYSDGQSSTAISNEHQYGYTKRAR
jgi:hypothetical protein